VAAAIFGFGSFPAQLRDQCDADAAVQAACGTKVTVVTHAQREDDHFWKVWRHGAEMAAQHRAQLDFKRVGYDADNAVAAIDHACADGQALVVTVPFREGTPEYAQLDAAISACTAKIPVFTASTDTYHNKDVFAFVGSSSYEMGEMCAMAILHPDDPDIATGRKAADPLNEPEIVADGWKVSIYWDATEERNEPKRQMMLGLKGSLEMAGANVELITTQGDPSCPCLEDYPESADRYLVDDGSSVGAIQVSVNGTEYLYPGTYGLSTCAAHDAQLAPDCNGFPAEDWCGKSWCYVDENNCTLGNLQPSVYIPNSTLTFSYKACGEVNTFTCAQNGTCNAAGAGPVSRGEKTLTVVLKAANALKFLPAETFICGEEAVELEQYRQLGASPFSQGLTAVSQAIVAATADGEWMTTKGNSGGQSSTTASRTKARFTFSSTAVFGAPP
jgi:hypothetical protein